MSQVAWLVLGSEMRHRNERSGKKQPSPARFAEYNTAAHANWTGSNIICLEGEQTMRKALLLVGSCVALAMLLTVMITTQPFASPQDALQKWGPNDRSRPEPPIITPGTASTQEHPGKPPSDAIVLFNGKDLSNWESVKDGARRSGPWAMVISPRCPAPGTSGPKAPMAIANCTWNGPRPTRPRH